MSPKSRLCVLYVLPILLSDSLAQEQDKGYCLKNHSYKSFDLESLAGDWYPTYFWPKELGPQDCVRVTYEKIAASQTGACRGKIEGDQTVMESRHTGRNGRTVILYTFGGDVKHFSLDYPHECVMLDGALSDLGNGFVLFSACRFEFHTLLARNVTSSAELQSVVRSIEHLRNLEGAACCVK